MERVVRGYLRMDPAIVHGLLRIRKEFTG